MKPTMVIRDPAAFQLLADETRRKIVYLLRVKEMTVSQIASELGVTSQAVYHHIRKLLKGEIVEVVREERIGHLIESYYRATAESFTLSEGKIKGQTFRNKELAKEHVATVLTALKRLGFKLEFDENKISQLVDLQVELEECHETEKLEDAIYDMNDLDFLTQSTATNFAKTLSMSDEEFARRHETRKKLRDLLRSLVKK